MLNKEQQAAVTYVSGPLLVLAGAGSGKTRVITHKIEYLITKHAIKASRIVALTFTNKAANEMKARIKAVVTADLRRGITIATFHTLGLKILKQGAQRCDLSSSFSIFDSDDSMQLLRRLLPPSKAADVVFLKALQQQCSTWKNALLTPKDIWISTQLTDIQSEMLHVYDKYQQALRAYNAVDFDDLILLPVTLLRDPEFLQYWQNKIRYLLIDEYQDSNTCQYEFVKQLVGTSGQFTAVGDDDQSIYAWRGARPENLLQLQTDFNNLKVIKLEQNYRSTQRILHAANHLIANNPHVFEKQLWSKLGAGEMIRVLVCKDENDEAEQVVADLINSQLRLRSPYGQYAILYRSNHQSRPFETILRAHGIPYRISGGQSWFARSEIKDWLAYLKLLCNPADDASFLRIINTPKRGIGDVSLKNLNIYAKNRQQSLYNCCDHMALSAMLDDKPRAALQHFKSQMYTLQQRLSNEPVITVLREFVADSGYEAYIYEQSDSTTIAQKRIAYIFELFEWIERLMQKPNAPTLAEVINTLILIDILEQSDKNDEQEVQLMTLHAAKGLEFNNVYLVGMEEEIIPHRASIDANLIEEERRLAYVGVTRAQQYLCLTIAKLRKRNGELQECNPSRFLEELPDNILEWHGLGERDEAKSKAIAKNHLAGLLLMLDGK